MKYRTPLAKARGLGSAKSGTGHWWLQRVTAAALIPASYWLLQLLHLTLSASYSDTLAWLANPLNTVGVVAFLVLAFYHAGLGLRVVIEDYVGGEGAKILLIGLVNLLLAGLFLIAFLAVIRALQLG